MLSRMKLPTTFSKHLPPAAIAAIRKLRPDNKYPDIGPLLAAVDYPNDSVGPRADSLTPAQRAMAELITELNIETSNNDIDQWMPRRRADRRSWLGLDPPQPLDREYTFTLAGAKRTEPGWRALKLLSDAEEGGRKGQVAAWLATVPVAERLAMFGQVNLSASEPWGLNEDDFFDPQDKKLVASLRNEGKTWAPAYADQWLAVRAAGEGKTSPPLWPMLAMVRAKLKIEQRWEVLMPVGLHTTTREILEALPANRRGPTFLLGLQQMGHPGWALNAAKVLLPVAPDAGVMAYALECIKSSIGAERAHLDALAKAAKGHPELIALVDAVRDNRPPVIALTTTALRDVAKEGAAARFSKIDEAQLLAAGRAYFGKKVPLSRLLSLNPNDEQSLRAVLSYRALADAKGKHVHDVWEYAGDSGSMFRAGTTEEVAAVTQGDVECDDAALKDALEMALQQKAPKTKTKAAKPTSKPTPTSKTKAKLPSKPKATKPKPKPAAKTKAKRTSKPKPTKSKPAARRR